MNIPFYMIDWIKISQLESLGITKEAFYTLVIFLGIMACYYIIRPVSMVLISLQSEKLVSYLLSGLLFLVIFFSIVLFVGEIQLFTYQLLKISLQALAVFGLLLCVVHVVRQLIGKSKKI
ncbi:hypothetical protein [Ornithinibacillus californiensis]|uniref:hypothetical protein n=1 Tax=Ornithinibacillus californiensis TaxID=161536 RepID=UPI00064D9E69|nr:hypothetical protein [Ornithinibacillus californiensis]